MSLIYKIILRLYRLAGWQDKALKIIKGPLRGFLWSVKITDSRYIRGTYEPVSTKLFAGLIKKNDVVFDVGANAGYFTLLFSKLSRPDNVFAFEPLPENLELLNRHLDLNKVGEVHVLPIAVSDREGEIEFSDSGNPSANTYKKESGVFSTGKKIPVKISSIDRLVNSGETPVPHFIKIDVEGAEADVLRGAADTLKNNSCILLLATHECHVPGIEQECAKILNELGYFLQPINEEKEIPGQRDFIVQKA